MKSNEIINNDYEIFLGNSTENDFLNHVAVLSFNQVQLQPYCFSIVHLRSTLFILVLSGTGNIEINFRKYELKSKDIVLVSFGHFFKITQLSDDFSCISLYVTKDYVDEMYSADMLYKRVKYGVRMHGDPLLNLEQSDFLLLKKRLSLIDEIVNTSGHKYHKEMILNALRIYFLDLESIIEKEEAETNDLKPSREENYFHQFLDLLVKYYQSEHLVEFYANKIHVTPHYLTLIVKRLSGQTISDFIFQLLYSEAKLLLHQPDLSIQQIAFQLNFSDQSAFGKFFKRKSGMSPREFRSNIFSK